MGIKDIIELINSHGGTPMIGIVIIIALTLVQISPIKVNPWDAILKWIGNKLNADIKKEIKDVKKDIDNVKKDLDAHIENSRVKDLRDTRLSILEFCASIINGQQHTKEQFDFMITQCDQYEEYIEKNDVKNGVVTSAIKEIRKRYDYAIHNNSFFKDE